jgi:hypothetical protein
MTTLIHEVHHAVRRYLSEEFPNLRAEIDVIVRQMAKEEIETQVKLRLKYIQVDKGVLEDVVRRNVGTENYKSQVRQALKLELEKLSEAELRELLRKKLRDLL